MLVRPIVSARWMADHLADRSVRPVDVRWYLGEPGRGRREYEAAHIPGAVFADLENDLSAPNGPGRHPLPDPNEFARRMGSLGIGDDTHVVAYDDSGGAIAARLWWMLRHVGHPAVSVLDGGFSAWRRLGLPVETGTGSTSPAAFEVREVRHDAVNRDELARLLGTALVLDARAPERYRGEREPIDPAAGHIPSAMNAPFTDNLEPDGTFKPPEALARYYNELGVEPTTPVVATCGSGVTACHTILALHVAGMADALLYPGSWSDWSSAGYPVAVGSEPGTVPQHIP